MLENLENLVQELRHYPQETQWFEFKVNNSDPQMIAKSISALANGAVLADRPKAYLLWGIDDKTHDIIGTEISFHALKKGNEGLENWLRQLLSSNVDFEYGEVIIENKKVGVLMISAAMGQPVTFEKNAYVRVSSHTVPLAKHPILQAKLWKKLQTRNYEKEIAKSNLELSAVLGLLDYETYFKFTHIEQPESIDEIAFYLIQEEIILKQDNGLYAITNLGAVLFAKRISDFSSVERKAIRLVQYENNNRLKLLREMNITKGYVAGFEDLMEYLDVLIPSEEIINGAVREKKTAYPLIALRELIANALIHQDFSISGTGPTIEIFADRIDITNPGVLLVDLHRIVDSPPKSRNEKLAGLMRRMKLCEELGTGWDKVVSSCELNMLPAPKINFYEDSVRVTLYSHIDFAKIAMEERIWACYLHACILFVQGNSLTNSSLRKRFGVKLSASGSISRVIKLAVERNLIKVKDSKTAPRYMSYIPIWA